MIRLRYLSCGEWWEHTRTFETQEHADREARWLLTFPFVTRVEQY